MVKLSYTDIGQGPVILFIHGGFVNGAIWEPQVDYFKNYFRVINVDMRGHGKSLGYASSEYSVAQLGQDIVHLMNELNIKKAILCGMSLGAMVSQWIGAFHPEKVAGLCLVGGVASLKLTPIETIVTTFFFPKKIALWLFDHTSTPQFMKISFFLTWFMRGGKWLGTPASRERIRECISMMDRKEIRKVYAAFHDFRKQPLKSGLFPSIVINGQFDSPIIHFHGKYLANKLNASGFHKIPNCGHACNFDDPVEFNKIVHDWLRAESLDHISNLSADKELNKAKQFTLSSSNI